MTPKTLPQMPALDIVVSQVLSVSREEYLRHEKAYKKQAPHKRGPKPKTTAASRASAARG